MSSQPEEFEQRYICAVCWSHLVELDGALVCAKYGEGHEGYVTKAYAERRRSESHGEALEVHKLLLDIGAIPARDEKTILGELGFQEESCQSKE